MISSLAIKRFRGIRECKIDGLSEINIFMGRNNSGKSSILEALYLASAAFSFSEPLERGSNKLEYLLNRRCDRKLRWIRRQREVLWYGYDSALAIEVELKPENHRKLKIELHSWHPHPLTDVPNTSEVRTFYKGLDAEPHDFPYACFEESSLLHRRTSRSIGQKNMAKLFDRITGDFVKTRYFFENVMFIDTNLIHNMEKVERNLWNDLLKKRLDKLVTNVLRKGYDVDVEGMTYMPYGDTYQLAVQLPKTTTRADDLGDGARYSMVLLMVAALAKNTAILIEEPENHQHPGGLAKSIEMLLDLTKKNNVQLFASTHSREFSILIEQIAKERNIDLTTFFIERDKQGYVDVRKVKPKDAEILRKMGLDIRFLDII